MLVVDNGSTDGTAVVAQEIAANDPRFRVIRRPQLGVSASRNTGARLADGRFLTFVDATDTVPRTAYATLINSLRQTGSDFAAGSVRSVIRGRRRRPSWTTISHDLDRLGQTVSEFPLAMLDTGVTNKVFRKPFWDTVVGEFPISAAGASHAIIRATCRPGSSTSFRRSVACSASDSRPDSCFPNHLPRTNFGPASNGYGRHGSRSGLSMIRRLRAPGWAV